jgi:hypothetical protein
MRSKLARDLKNLTEELSEDFQRDAERYARDLSQEEDRFYDRYSSTSELKLEVEDWISKHFDEFDTVSDLVMKVSEELGDSSWFQDSGHWVWEIASKYMD